jgi:hypothetical protein
MDELIKQLKQLKNSSKEYYDDAIATFSKNQVLEELKDAGISVDELSSEEFNELLQEKIKENEAFSKGALVATGAFVFLELLG